MSQEASQAAIRGSISFDRSGNVPSVPEPKWSRSDFKNTKKLLRPMDGDPKAPRANSFSLPGDGGQWGDSGKRVLEGEVQSLGNLILDFAEESIVFFDINVTPKKRDTRSVNQSLTSRKENR